VLRAEARLGALALEEGEHGEACTWLDRACARGQAALGGSDQAAALARGRLLRRCGQAHLKRFDEDGLHYHLVP
jgi:hypothetical protein